MTTAENILAALREKHRRDVFMGECKLGPSWLGLHRRLDAFALKPTWTETHATGYEIKVTVKDYTADSKWRDYLPPLSHFYFVTPEGLLNRVPKPAGLIELTPGGVLQVKQKAERLEVRDSAMTDLLKYIVFWRLGLTPKSGDQERWPTIAE